MRNIVQYAANISVTYDGFYAQQYYLNGEQGTYTVPNTSGTVLVVFDLCLEFILTSKIMMELVCQSRPFEGYLLDVVCRQFLILNTGVELLNFLLKGTDIILC